MLDAQLAVCRNGSGENAVRRRVAFVLCYYPLGVSTMILNSIQLFAERGISVDVFIDDWNRQESPFTFLHENIRLHIFELRVTPAMQRAYKLMMWCSNRLSRLPALLRRAMPGVMHYLQYPQEYLFKRWLGRVLTEDYDFIFPVEAPSLIALGGRAAKVVYYNMELLDWDEGEFDFGKNLQLKQLEYRALAQVAGVAIQNPQRADYFRQVNRYDRPVYILPVASMGEPPAPGGRYFRDRFEIGDDVSIVIYSGNIARWAKCIEMVESTRDWPEKTCLILHTWSRDSLRSPYGCEVRQRADGLPVHISDEYIDPELLADCLSSADVGLMFYEPVDPNFRDILFSSNKLGEYLKAGLPVVTYDEPELKRFFAEQGIGATIPDIAALPDAIRQILRDRETYRRNVAACYHGVYRFDHYFDAMFDALYSGGSAPDDRVPRQ